MIDDRLVTAETRGLQIICGALMMGVFSFGGVALMLVNFGEIAEAGDILIPAILAGISLMSILPTQFLAYTIKNRQADGATSMEALIGQYRGGSIVGWAGLEGAAFMNLIAYIIAGQWWSLLVPVFAINWMALTFPTEWRIANWLRDRELQGGGT